jgi:hypothetical protein
MCVNYCFDTAQALTPSISRLCCNGTGQPSSSRSASMGSQEGCSAGACSIVSHIKNGVCRGVAGVAVMHLTICAAVIWEFECFRDPVVTRC